MKLNLDEYGLTGALAIKQFVFEDERGIFSHIYRKVDDSIDKLPDFKKIRNIYSSYNHDAFTFRGFHKQKEPHSEAKVMRCITGSLIHYILKIQENQTLLDYNELSHSNGLASYVPRDCFSGFITIEPRTTVIYLTDNHYFADSGEGIRWNDPILPQYLGNIIPQTISKKDQGYSNYQI